ncbi:segregation and condensation protein a [Heliomicrobium modesticaldum Ice1]|uniref:Segregation and condensation protein A n=1 Tax=Heliobacterium modesticaldum (strain ATCC 51547 / Ice1) TaxID=498761 RepID=B0TFC5_HELMI|nr:segregation/condensation protein A [Heliomicrobium modesticaldum]ABZ84442.1 segregation and condensation protein a [Heliomicrobium modesticaldum Ice1]
MAYRVSLPVFEGPFDLLVHLIEKNQVNIYDIPIAQIAAEYLAYLQQLDELDLERASAFLLMAAQLLAIKARMLLPKPPKAEAETEGDEGEDPRRELVDRLIEYRRYKAVAELLKEREVDRNRRFSRVVDPTTLAHLFVEENPLEGVMIGDLLAALRKALSRRAKEEPVAAIPREEVSVQARMQELLTSMAQLPPHAPIAFSTLFAGRWRPAEIIVTFLAMLELVRLKKVRVLQREAFDEIYLLASQL